ncbi:MAG: NAD(P)H-dependent oxidoreductase [Paracoccaceae bacterium]|nr:NAD(P)H-dependent oxidoreductase [Paracoccaceae bacterium]
MTRALILYAHPCGDSFASALHTGIVETLSERGWEIDDCDLYAEGFNPVLSDLERRGYHDEGPNIEPVADYVARLRAADTLILSFPVWNFGYPAMLKGFIDRVFLPGVSFKLVDGKVKPNLTHIKKLAAVTTYGGTRLRAVMAGDPPRKSVTRHLRYMTQPTRMRYLALYDMNRRQDAERGAFLNRVKQEMRSF